ncbi:MAG: insulinase family protein, partial [Acidimicrobiia bacterium]|nr:insulinase family protein [Acidimicrobiia bacterium]
MESGTGSRIGAGRLVVATIVVVVLSLLAAACTPGGGDDGARELDGPARGDSGGVSGQETGSVPTSMDFGSGPDIDGVSPPDTTPIEISADMTVGQLDNGLRYYIVENGAPGGQVELLLAVDAGSAQQPVPDSGNAHFLEHMMFNGTEDYPVNELDAVLRGLGVEIGPDLNAYTSFDETVYQMSMPTVDEDNLELGLRVLAQWAGAATINQSDVEAERGVVREEHRLRNESGGAEINERLFEYYTQNSGYENHLPIGSPEQILATDATELRAFYDDWYRPDNMAIIAVGDIDTATIERLIKQELAGLTDRGSSPPRTPVETGPITEPIVEVLTAEGGPEPSISLDYLWPTWDPSTVGGQRMLLADQLIASMLTAYLDEQAADPSVDIIRPFVGVAPVARSRRLLGMNAAANDYRQGPADLIRAMRSVEVNGFSERHLDQARRQALSAVDQTVAAKPTKQDFQYAEEITDHFLTGAPLENIEAWAARTTDQVESFTLDELNRIFRWEMGITVPILALLGSDPAELPSQAELADAVAEGLAGELLGQVDAEEIEQLLARPDGPDPVTEGEFFNQFNGSYR